MIIYRWQDLLLLLFLPAFLHQPGLYQIWYFILNMLNIKDFYVVCRNICALWLINVIIDNVIPMQCGAQLSRVFSPTIIV